MSEFVATRITLSNKLSDYLHQIQKGSQFRSTSQTIEELIWRMVFLLLERDADSLTLESVKIHLERFNFAKT